MLAALGIVTGDDEMTIPKNSNAPVSTEGWKLEEALYAWRCILSMRYGQAAAADARYRHIAICRGY